MTKPKAGGPFLLVVVGKDGRYSATVYTSRSALWREVARYEAAGLSPRVFSLPLLMQDRDTITSQ